VQLPPASAVGAAASARSNPWRETSSHAQPPTPRLQPAQISDFGRARILGPAGTVRAQSYATVTHMVRRGSYPLLCACLPAQLEAKGWLLRLSAPYVPMHCSLALLGQPITGPLPVGGS